MAGTYEYITESEFREKRAEWQEIIDRIKANQPRMLRVRVDSKTVLEIAENKNIKKVLRNYKRGRERYYAAD
ncbi:MAG: hypothetical protein ACK5MK_12580 [Dysgonomonas sp.]